VAGLETERLLLRRWKPEDRAPFARINSDPAVMEYFPALDRKGSGRALTRKPQFRMLGSD